MRKHINPSLAVSILALVLATTGSATAASLITSAQIKNNSITSADIKNRSITSVDIRQGGVARAALSESAVDTLQATPTTTVTKTEQSIPADNFTVAATANCPEGQVALGGGGAFKTRPDIGTIRTSKPVLDAQNVARSWTVTASTGNSSPGYYPPTDEALEVYVICSP